MAKVVPGQRGKAYDALVQCEAGLMSVTGTAEHLVKVNISVADIAAGMYGYAGILTALYQRERTGIGAHIAASLLDALGEWMSQPALWTRYSGAQPQRTGAHHATIAPYGPFPTADGIQVELPAVQSEREWARFVEQVLEQPNPIQDERFRGNANRIEHREQLDALVAAALSQLPFEEVIRRLDGAGIPNVRLNTIPESVDHVQLTARHGWTTTLTPAGPVEPLLPPVVSAELDVQIRPVPGPGEHTKAVLTELGFSGDEMEDMTSGGSSR